MIASLLITTAIAGVAGTGLGGLIGGGCKKCGNTDMVLTVRSYRLAKFACKNLDTMLPLLL